MLKNIRLQDSIAWWVLFGLICYHFGGLQFFFDRSKNRWNRFISAISLISDDLKQKFGSKRCLHAKYQLMPMLFRSILDKTKFSISSVLSTKNDRTSSQIKAIKPHYLEACIINITIVSTWCWFQYNVHINIILMSTILISILLSYTVKPEISSVGAETLHADSFSTPKIDGKT